MPRQFSTFQWVPPFAQGLVRELRVRWALEEAGLDYEQKVIGLADQQSPEYRSLQPFGQVPFYQDDRLSMFESGAIVLHIAENSERLLPVDPIKRARAQSWMFAALNTIEPRVQALAEIDLFYADQEWAKLRRPLVVENLKVRLADLSSWLKNRDYLEDEFTAGDLLMTTVLRILRHTDLVSNVENLETYRRRCEARPAFQKALADHLALFSNSSSSPAKD